MIRINKTIVRTTTVGNELGFKGVVYFSDGSNEFVTKTKEGLLYTTRDEAKLGLRKRVKSLKLRGCKVEQKESAVMMK